MTIDALITLQTPELDLLSVTDVGMMLVGRVNDPAPHSYTADRTTADGMPNFVRTLLLNQARTFFDTAVPGEEYVAPYFIPVTLPIALNKIRNILFGTSPSRTAVNYRLFQLLQMLHATELAEFMTYHDSRITYLPLTWQPMAAGTVQPATNMADALLTLQAALSMDDENVLFGADTQLVEPFATFRNLWRDHDMYAYKLGGLVLALAFRTAELAV